MQGRVLEFRPGALQALGKHYKFTLETKWKDLPKRVQEAILHGSGDDAIRFVYDELTGRVTPPDLLEDFGIYEGPSPTKDSPGWQMPKRIIVPNLMPARLAGE